MKKTIRFEIDTDTKQEGVIDKTLDATGFIRNKLLQLQIDRHNAGEKYLQRIPATEWVNNTIIKNNPDFSGTDKMALRGVAFVLDGQYQQFFKSLRNFPKFINGKEYVRKYRTPNNHGSIRIDFKEGRIRLPKVGWTRIRWYSAIPEQDFDIVSADVIRTKHGDGFSYSVEVNFSIP